MARRYEFYVRVARTIPHSFASLTREILFLPREHKIHIISNITDDEFTSELVIGEFQPADQATYKCVARNVYNNTVETSTRICKSRTVLMKTSSPRSTGIDSE